MTVTIAPTLQEILDLAVPQEVFDVLRLMHLGTMLTPLLRTFTGLASSATQNLTQIDATGETTGPTNPNRLAALSVTTLRATAGSDLGAYSVTDSGGTASAGASGSPGVALLSADGTTITFPGAVTAFVIQYIPRSYTSMTTVPAGSGIGFSP